MSKLFSASASVRHQGRRVVDSSEGMSESVPATSPNVDFLGRRRSFNPSLVLGAGIKHKVGLDFVFTELRYSAGLKNVVDPRNLYADPEIEHTSPEYVRSQDLQAFGHVDDFFRLDNIGLTVGYIRPLYKPRELKRVRTQSVLRKMKKGK